MDIHSIKWYVDDVQFHEVSILDKGNSNSFEVWKKMGSPQNPSQEQIAEFKKAGQLPFFNKCILYYAKIVSFYK